MSATPRASYPGARRCSSIQAPGCTASRCGSFASSGLPVAVREPATTQSFDPCAFGRGSSSSSRPPSEPAATVGGSAGSGGSSVRDRVGSQAFGDRDAQQLGVPVPGEPPRQEDERRGPRALVVGRQLRRQVEQRVLDGRRRHRRDPCGDALRGTGRASRARSSSQPAAMRAPARWNPIVRANRSSGERAVGEDLGQPARSRLGAAGRAGTGVRRP